MIFGISGREGAGKSSIVNLYKSEKENTYIKIYIDDPLKKVADILFLNPDDLKKLLEKYFNLDDLFPNKWCYIDSENSEKIREYSFAGPLKLIVSIICDFNLKNTNVYEILKGDNKFRDLREKIITYDKFGKAYNGREILQFVGTEVFRNNIDSNFWINLTLKKIEADNETSNISFISDVRFQNEIDILLYIGARLILVYRKDEDLILTEDDKKKHPSSWDFLQDISKFEFKIHNNGTLQDLKEKIDNILDSER